MRQRFTGQQQFFSPKHLAFICHFRSVRILFCCAPLDANLITPHWRRSCARASFYVFTMYTFLDVFAPRSCTNPTQLCSTLIRCDYTLALILFYKYMANDDQPQRRTIFSFFFFFLIFHFFLSTIFIDIGRFPSTTVDETNELKNNTYLDLPSAEGTPLIIK